MKRICQFISCIYIILSLFFGCQSEKYATYEGRETVQDSIVYIEDKLVT